MPMVMTVLIVLLLVDKMVLIVVLVDVVISSPLQAFVEKCRNRRHLSVRLQPDGGLEVPSAQYPRTRLEWRRE